MLTSNRVLGVRNGQLWMDPSIPQTKASAVYGARRDHTLSEMSKMQEVTAALTTANGVGAINGANMHVKGFWQSNYQYYMTGLIPADPSLIDTSNLSLFYRDMYLFDNTAGSCVDIQSSFPFSDWELRGLDDHELKVYNQALERLSIRQMLPLISTAYLVDGFFCGSLVFDQRSRQFIDTLIHDALQCAVIPSPFFNIDPTINVRVGQATQQFMHDTSPYAKRYLNRMPQQFRDMLLEGAFTLDPVSTLFVGRRTLTDRAYISFLHRILPMYLIEKTMFRGTLVEAQRRQRAVTHLTAGDDQWTPTAEELGALVEQFQMAEYDPLGGWISTRNAVQAVDIRPGGDFWKWTDMADIFVAYKLRALGVSESFLSGDASYASAESAYSTFLESQNAYRMHLTDQVFYRKLFPLIALVNDMYKDPRRKARPGQVLDYLFNQADRENLRVPTLHWTKSLEPKGEENLFDMLEKASDKGVPIPLKMWMAAAGVDPDALERDLKDDSDYRKQLAQYTGKNTSHEAEDKEGDDDEDYGSGIGAHLAHLRTTESVNHSKLRKGLHARNFDGGLTEVYESNKSGSDRKYIHNQRAAVRKQNENIAKIAARAAQDDNYRRQLAQQNLKSRGYSKIPLAMQLPASAGLIRGR